MHKKEITWICILAVLVAIYVRYFSNWNVKTEIGISASVRPNRHHGGSPDLVVFTLNNEYKLTALKVLPLDGTNFNPGALPVWNLVSDSNSVGLRAFRYGQPIKGMRPALNGVRPNALTTGSAYRLILTAGKLTGHKDFKANLGQ